MENGGKSEKFACCLGCLSSNNDITLYDYKINNGTLKSITQVDEICLCYICRHLAQKTEIFIQNIQSNQILLENIRNNITTSILETARTHSQVVCLTSTTLDPVEVGNDKCKNVLVKVEVKNENGLSNHSEGELVDDNNDFQDSSVTEEDDFALKDLLKQKLDVDGLAINLRRPVKRGKVERKITTSILETARTHSQVVCLTSTTLDPVEVGSDKCKNVLLKVEVKNENGLSNHSEGELVDDNNDFQDSSVTEEDDFALKDLLKQKLDVDGLAINLRRPVKRGKVERKVGKKKKHRRSKQVIDVENDRSERDDPSSDSAKDETVVGNLKTAAFDKSQIRKSKGNDTKKDVCKTKTVYITRDRCMEERAEMAADKKYLNCTYKCADCVKGFHLRESYDRHMESHQEAMGNYECDICKQRMDSKVKLVRHKRCHEVRYKCTVCGLTRINRLTIREHYNAFHLKLYSYGCPHCPKAFKRQVSLRKHIAYLHGSKVRVKCQHCQKMYANKEVLRAHMIARHPREVSAGAAPRRCVCRECGAAFAAPSQLRNHSVKHSLARDYYCVECDKSFKSEAAFKRHVKVAAPHVDYADLPLPCGRCDKRFAIRRDLERHVNRVHLNIKPFQCDRCDRAYVNNWSLNEHKRYVHDGHKRPLKYPCSMCDKVFDRNQTLKAHVRTHTGERPFPCARCAARFAQSSALGTHVRLVHLRLARDGTPRRARDH